MHTYIHTCIHAYIHTYMHAYIHTYMHAYMHAYIHTYIHCITSLYRLAHGETAHRPAASQSAPPAIPDRHNDKRKIQI